jgi:hypothetical protein
MRHTAAVLQRGPVRVRSRARYPPVALRTARSVALPRTYTVEPNAGFMFAFATGMETTQPSSPETQPAPGQAESHVHHWNRDELRAEAQEAWDRTAKAARRPGVGAAIAGGAVLAATAVLGASEAAVAAVAAYGVYRILKRKDPDPQSPPEEPSSAPDED